jgi:hypothetical protein
MVVFSPSYLIVLCYHYRTLGKEIGAVRLVDNDSEGQYRRNNDTLPFN